MGREVAHEALADDAGSSEHGHGDAIHWFLLEEVQAEVPEEGDAGGELLGAQLLDAGVGEGGPAGAGEDGGGFRGDGAHRGEVRAEGHAAPRRSRAACRR